MSDLSMFSLEGRCAIVSGGNSGLGLGIAEALARAGAKLCIWGRDQRRNGEAVERLSEHGHGARAIECDVSSEQYVEAAFSESMAFLGRIDVCVANAGIYGQRTPITELDGMEWSRVLGVNLAGAMLTFRAAARAMIAQNTGGSLIATSSLASRMALPLHSQYAASKAGVCALVRALAVELAPHGIRANSILPGWFESRMTERAFSRPAFKEAVLPKIPLGRWGQAADLAGAAVYLASDASRYHTGDELVIDGGFSLL